MFDDWPERARAEMLKFLAAKKRQAAINAITQRLGPTYETKIRELWFKEGLSLDDLAQAIGFDKQVISRYAREKMGLPERAKGPKGLRWHKCPMCQKTHRSFEHLRTCANCRKRQRKLTSEPDFSIK